MAISITGSTSNAQGTAGVNRTLNLPASIVAGERLIAGIGGGTTGNVSWSWPAGWNEIYDTAGNPDSMSIAYREADGTEGASITVVASTSLNNSSGFCYRVSGHDTALPPEVGTAATGSSAAADPPSVTPSWGSRSALWVACVKYRSATALTSYPTNYTLGQENPTTTNNSFGASARVLTASSEDPGTYSQPNVNWRTQTIAVAALLGVRNHGYIF